MTVFVRTPQYVMPMRNPKFTPADQEAYKSKFEWLAKRLPHTFSGFEHDFEHLWAELTPEQRRAVLEEIWEDGSLKFWIASFGELFFDPEVSEQVSEFVREKMRARLKDPRLCDILIPKDYGFGTHRVRSKTASWRRSCDRTSKWSASRTTRLNGLRRTG